MQKLMDDMTDPELEKRPIIEEVTGIEQFGNIRDSSSTIKLRSTITRKKDLDYSLRSGMSGSWPAQ